MSEVTTGSCLCGGVAYEVTGPLRDVIGCHCIQCRKTSGHHVAATATLKTALKLVREDTLRWYRASPAAQRGFCGECGGNLFWRPDEGENVSIFAGTLDGDQKLPFSRHIFAQFKGAYYEFPDGAEIFPELD